MQPQQKPTVSTESNDERAGQRGEPATIGKPHGSQEESDARGEATVHDGSKVYGDELDGMIPPLPGNRPTRDDGDNDDLGELR